jgi:hypothetical protein
LYQPIAGPDAIHLGEGWFEYIPGQGISSFAIPEDEGGPSTLAPFLKVELNLGDPTLMGTRGLDMPVYAEPLVAQAFLAPLPQNFQSFPLSRLQHPFDMCLERAVALMGDMGVAADVYRYQQLPQ